MAVRVIKLKVPGLQGETGEPGDDGIASIFVQNSAPATTYSEGSIWIDADSEDSDLYQLTDGAWVDTEVNLRGVDGEPATAVSGMTVSGTSMTYDSASHNAKMICFTADTDITVTLPNGETAHEAFGWYQAGDGQILFVKDGGGVPLHSRDHDRSFGLNSAGTCFVNQAQEWVLSGDTE